MSKRIVRLERICEKRVPKNTICKQLEYIATRGLGGSRGSSWQYNVTYRDPVEFKNNWKYNATISLQKTGGQQDKEEKQFELILKHMLDAAGNRKFAEKPWIVVEPKITKEIKNASKEYGIINLDKGTHFDHIYDRDPHIEIVHSALSTFQDSEFNKRFHTVLFGPPGCAKTEILLACSHMLGTENEAYLWFDATSTTEAGASKMLLESDYIPPVLIVEEIEKTDEKSLRWLLGVLDQRGEIRRTNYRIGHQSRNVKMLCFATVNDIDLFRKVMSGALASRFSHQIYCERPTREIMYKILEREVLSIDGNISWIEPTLKFAFDELKWNDPRKIIPICLCGKDKLLDGTYQSWYRRVCEKQKEEK